MNYDDLRKTRLALKLSMAQAAKICCVDKSTYWRWEVGETNMPQCAEELFEIKTRKIWEGLRNENEKRHNRKNEKKNEIDQYDRSGDSETQARDGDDG